MPESYANAGTGIHSVQRRRPQRIFRYSEHAVAQGLPSPLVGAPFLCQPGRNDDLANEYLADLWTGAWSRAARQTTMARAIAQTHRDGSPTLANARSSILRTASRLCRLLDWVHDPAFHSRIAAPGTPTVEGGTLDLLKASERDVDRLATAMETRGAFIPGPQPASPAYIAACQICLIDLLRYLEHRGLRGPLVLTPKSRAQPFSSGPPGGEGHAVVRRVNVASVRPITARQADTIIAAIPTAAYRMAAALIFKAGLRACEVLVLRNVDVPSGNGEAPGVMRVLGKGRRWRSVPVDGNLQALITAYRAGPRASALAARPDRAGPSTFLLDDRDGEDVRYHTLHAAFVAAGEETGLAHRCTPHLGRHSYATEYLLREWRLLTAREHAAAGPNAAALAAALSILSLAPLEELRRNLGHAQLDTTRRYLVTLSNHVRADLATLHARRISGTAA